MAKKEKETKVKKIKEPKVKEPKVKEPKVKKQKKRKPRKMSIKTKLLAPAGLLVVLMLVVVSINSYIKQKEKLIEMGVEEAVMAANIAVTYMDGETISALDPGDETTAGYKTSINDLRVVQNTCGIKYLYTLYTDGNKVYYGLDTDSSEEQAYIGEEYEDTYEDLKSVFEGEDYVQDYIYESEGEYLISAYKPILDMSGEVVAVMGCDYDAASVQESLDVAVRDTVVISVVSVLIALIVLGILVTAVTRNLSKVDEKIYDLVHSEGDLTKKLEVKTGDEMEMISENVNSLLEHIRRIMLNIADNSLALNNSSKLVVDSLGGAEENITDVSATMEQMSAAMEETNAALSEVANSILQIHDAIEGIAENAESGKTSSNEIMKKAAKIYESAAKNREEAIAKANVMAEAVNDKVEKSKAVDEIRKLTENIISITDQTNLLALNASIEAARAGEAGRGFAVVADEIGKLATDSATAAARIQEVSQHVVDAVNELAEEAENMIVFMNETAMEGYEKLIDTSESYEKDVRHTNDMMKDFADASVQLMGNIDNIKNSVNAVNIAVDESTNGIAEVTEMAMHLRDGVMDIGNEADSNMEIAGRLSAEVNKFKLS